jgi:Spy/CpxP family protein refolding chaperone
MKRLDLKRVITVLVFSGLTGILTGGLTAAAQTQHHQGTHAKAMQHGSMQTSPYAGQQNRGITSLSADDREALSKGEGWGLAKPAELNGVPGPAHLLELSEQIGLSEVQVEQLQKLFRDMKAQAIALGHEYMAAEAALDDYFRAAELDDRVLRQKVDQAEQARANLRFLHLSYHHRTLDVVTDEQVKAYNKLRGYDNVMDDPCANIPEGHDPVMFRKHMGCD